MRYLLKLTGLPGAREVQVSASVPDEWVGRVVRAAKDIAAVPADLVVQEINGLWPRTVTGILTALSKELPVSFLWTLRFGDAIPAWGECDDCVDCVDLNVVIDFGSGCINVS